MSENETHTLDEQSAHLIGQLAALKRQLAEARESLDFQIKINREIIDREAKLLAELAEAKDQRDRLSEQTKSLRSLCTTDHESKAAFIDRVNAILYPPNAKAQTPPESGMKDHE